MNILILWNSASKTFIEGLIKSMGLTEIKYVTNRKDFKISEIENFSQILILAELYWENVDWQGYEIAREILHKIQTSNKAPNIQFVSLLSRGQLYDITSGISKYFVKCFNHYQIPEQTEFHFEEYSVAKWNYHRKYGLTKDGILDIIQHKLLGVVNQPAILKKYVHDAIEELRLIPEIAGKEINDLVSEYLPDKKELEKFIGQLNTSLIRRIGELSPKKAATDIRDEKKKSKYRILLVEDQKEKLSELKSLFSEFYTNISDFSDGTEALKEMTTAGIFYHTLITDLELLAENQKFHQPKQGIELLEFSERHYPHLARRVITQLGTRGVKELLPRMSESDIIFKKHLFSLKDSDSFYDFILKLDRDIEKSSVLLNMQGPNTAFWADITRQGNEGGRFKRYYYDLKIYNETRFNEVWNKVNETVNNALEHPEEHTIPSGFIKIEDARTWLEENDDEMKIAFLCQLLMHRLIMINKYGNGDLVFYKSDKNKSISYFDSPFWAGPIPHSPKQYLNFVGFGQESLKSSTDSKQSEITFNLKYGKLFPEEVDFIKANSRLRKIRATDLYDSFPEFCETAFEAYQLILKEILQNRESSRFKFSYPELWFNATDIDEDSFIKFFKLILHEENPVNDVKGSIIKNLFLDYDDKFDIDQLPKKLNDLVKELIDHLGFS